VVYASPSIDMLHAQYEGRAQGYTSAREGRLVQLPMGKNDALYSGWLPS
jgi:hypothetical protein